MSTRGSAPARPAPAQEAFALAVLGAGQSLALVHTAFWFVPLLAITLLVWRLDGTTRLGHAFFFGWAYAFGWIGASVWWLFISMHRYGHLPAWLAATAVAALAAALALLLGVAALVYRRGRRRRLRDALLFAALWLAAELARGQLLTGFPWGASGYTQIDGPLAVLAPEVGVYGMGALLSWLGAALARPWRGGLLVVAVLIGLAWGGGAERAASHTTAGARLRVELLQPNVPQDEKFADARLPATLAWVASRLDASTAELVVAPETAVPLLPEQLEMLAPGYWPAIERRFATGAQAALIGVPLGSYERGYTNSVVGLGGETSAATSAGVGGGVGGGVGEGMGGGKGSSAMGAGAGYRYDKHHLVPFGEFIPPGFRWFTDAMKIPLGDFARGAVAQPSFAVKGERAAPNICYEDLFGEELARRFAGGRDVEPTLFVNISNIGWFGDTIAVAQHLNVSRLRALEFQRPMLRATNTGATAVIDHHGRVTARLAPFSEGVLKGEVEARHGLTPYARWAGTWGLWPAWALAIGLAALVIAIPTRRGGRRAPEGRIARW